MSNPGKGIDFGFTTERFPEGIHLCLIYDQEEEREMIVSEYMSAGLRNGEKVRYFADTTSPEKVQSWLAEMGVDLPEAVENGQFGIFKAQNAYCTAEGRFDPQEMIAGMIPKYEQAKKAGYTGMRSCGEMTWTLHGIPGSERLLEYEVMLNEVHYPFPHSGMCQYDARVFDGATLFNILKVHPWMVVRGKVVQNPYYLSPEEFLSRGKTKKS